MIALCYRVVRLSEPTKATACTAAQVESQLDGNRPKVRPLASTAEQRKSLPVTHWMASVAIRDHAALLWSSHPAFCSKLSTECHSCFCQHLCAITFIVTLYSLHLANQQHLIKKPRFDSAAEKPHPGMNDIHSFMNVARRWPLVRHTQNILVPGISRS